MLLFHLNEFLDKIWTFGTVFRLVLSPYKVDFRDKKTDFDSGKMQQKQRIIVKLSFWTKYELENSVSAGFVNSKWAYLGLNYVLLSLLNTLVC